MPSGMPKTVPIKASFLSGIPHSITVRGVDEGFVFLYPNFFVIPPRTPSSKRILSPSQLHLHPGPAVFEFEDADAGMPRPPTFFPKITFG